MERKYKTCSAMAFRFTGASLSRGMVIDGGEHVEGIADDISSAIGTRAPDPRESLASTRSSTHSTFVCCSRASFKRFFGSLSKLRASFFRSLLGNCAFV